jgi:hypothetical protein
MSTPISVADQGFKLPVSVTNIGTTQTAFTDAGGSAIVVNLPPYNVQPLTSDTDFLRSTQNRPFDLKAWGRVTTATTSSFQPSIFVGNNATLASDSSLIAPAAVSIVSASGSWLLEAELMWDVTGLKINGIYWGWINGTATAQTIVTSAVALTAANFFTPAAGTPNGLSFLVAVSFSVGNAGNTAWLDGFDADFA